MTVYKISKILTLNTTTRILYFDGYIPAKPGQFVLLWLPRNNQKPFCISSVDETGFAICIQRRGSFTSKLFFLERGDSVGIQGPLGRPFVLKGKQVLLVGQGYGIGALSFLSDTFAYRGGNSVSFIYTQKKEKSILAAIEGAAYSNLSDIQQVLIQKSIDMVYIYGSERMMKTVLNQCAELQIDAQVIVEGYIKCGIGICGHCVSDPEGWRCCVEGPVFDRDVALRMQGLGTYKRGETGAICKLID